MSSLPSIVVSLLAQDFGCGNVSDACPKALLLAKTIKQLLEDAEDGVVDVTQEENLELEEDEVDPNWILPDKVEPSTPGKTFVVIGGRQVEKKTVEQALVYYRSAEKGTRTLAAMSNRYRWIKSKDHLGRLREYEEEVASRQRKIDEIKDKLLVWVLDQMEAGISLHDWNLRHQALHINREHYQLDGFKACSTFLDNFKKANRICSRRVTRFVAKKALVDADKLNDASLDFVKKVKDLMVKEGIPESAVFNGDQSGFVKVQHSTRSLAIVGQKAVFRAVGSVSATTHSSTILPQVSAAGVLRKKVCVVLQEPGGRLPAKGHFKADNLTVFAHSSHIMTKPLMVKWLKECVFTPDLPSVSLLILDSWPPFKEARACREEGLHYEYPSWVHVEDSAAGPLLLHTCEEVYEASDFARAVGRIEFPCSSEGQLAQDSVPSVLGFRSCAVLRLLGLLVGCSRICGPTAAVRNPGRFCLLLFDAQRLPGTWMQQHLLHPMPILSKISVFHLFFC